MSDIPFEERRFNLLTIDELNNFFKIPNLDVTNLEPFDSFDIHILYKENAINNIVYINLIRLKIGEGYKTYLYGNMVLFIRTK